MYSRNFDAFLKQCNFLSMNIATISSDQLEHLIQSNFPPFIIDVREPKELATFGIIPGSVNIESASLHSKLHELPSDKKHTIVVVCQTGARSVDVVRLLQKGGFSNVLNLTGGMLDWILRRKIVDRVITAE